MFISFVSGQIPNNTNTDKVVETVQTESVDSENVQNQSQEELQYFNPHYFHYHHPLSPPPLPHHDEVQEHSIKPAHYQPLHTDARDYISMYSSTTAAGRRRALSVEVEEKLYSIYSGPNQKGRTCLLHSTAMNKLVIQFPLTEISFVYHHRHFTIK